MEEREASLCSVGGWGMAWREFLLIQSKRTTALKATWQQVCCDMGDLTENRDPADVTDAWRLCPLDLKIRMDEIRAPPKIRQL